jgi:hypothetical protein
VHRIVESPRERFCIADPAVGSGPELLAVSDSAMPSTPTSPSPW